MPTIAGLYLYPIKSCGGIAVDAARLGACGLEANGIGDREWMVVDPAGDFVSQRGHPALARAHTAFATGGGIEVSAPGLPGLRLPVDDAQSGARIQVSVWRDIVPALDAGEAPADWFSQLLGTPVRVVRYAREARRLADPGWTKGLEAQSRFADAFPLLLISNASLADLNERWTRAGHAALPMERFRPNLVIDGVEAYEEDHLRALTAGAIELRPVKPCARCSIPSVDQASGAVGASPTELLAGYRFDRSVGGATFGQNAIVVAGAGETLVLGQGLEAIWNF